MLCEWDTIGPQTKTTKEDLFKFRFNFVEVLAPPRGFEPLAGPVLWAL